VFSGKTTASGIDFPKVRPSLSKTINSSFEETMFSKPMIFSSSKISS
jgi:hypothetical protein